MKEKLLYAGFVLFLITAIGLLVFGVRLFSNATTPITVHEVEPGVKCATMVTSDGAAISCWKVDP